MGKPMALAALVRLRRSPAGGLCAAIPSYHIFLPFVFSFFPLSLFLPFVLFSLPVISLSSFCFSLFPLSLFLLLSFSFFPLSFFLPFVAFSLPFTSLSSFCIFLSSLHLSRSSFCLFLHGTLPQAQHTHVALSSFCFSLSSFSSPSLLSCLPLFFLFLPLPPLFFLLSVSFSFSFSFSFSVSVSLPLSAAQCPPTGSVPTGQSCFGRHTSAAQCPPAGSVPTGQSCFGRHKRRLGFRDHVLWQRAGHTCVLLFVPHCMGLRTQYHHSVRLPGGVDARQSCARCFWFLENFRTSCFLCLLM